MTGLTLDSPFSKEMFEEVDPNWLDDKQITLTVSFAESGYSNDGQ